MSKRVYKVIEDSTQDRFRLSTAKVQIFGGGYGNGKTTAACIKGLRLAKEYPGSNGLIARATYPKLNDTIRKEFMGWCPTNWVKRSPTKDDNTAYLTNGSIVNFRYVSQTGKQTESTTSNLLSATYDWAIVDQFEDPEFSHKDFMDLMGRLRGNTEYAGDDRTMPKSGPRWLIITLNPTRNWCFRELVKPLHDFQKGIYNPKLLCEVGDDARPIMQDGLPTPIIALYEGSTLENVDNVGEDYIKGMLTSYTGAMRDRYVYGKWGALSGLVYPGYNETIHLLQHDEVVEYLRQLRRSGFEPQFIEGYDHGLRVPSCYGLSFVDDDGNVFLLDGFHAPEQLIELSAQRIGRIREQYNIRDTSISPIYADPNLFKRTAASKSKVGVTVAELFNEIGIRMQHGANDIGAGIGKNAQYLVQIPNHEHPITGMRDAPYFYVSDNCPWFTDEINEYYWTRDGSGDETDKPTDRKDHAMDMWKYMMTSRPKLAKFIGKPDAPPQYLSWHEVERAQAVRQNARHT